MQQLTFWVEHEPIPQPRPAITTHTGHARAYVRSSHPVHAWRQALTNALSSALARASVTLPRFGGVELDATFYLPRPKRLYRKKDPQGPVWHTKKPDLDNLLKSCLDGLCQSETGLEDDNCIAVIRASKYYTSKTGEPCAKIVLRWPLEGGQHELAIAREAQQMVPGHPRPVEDIQR